MILNLILRTIQIVFHGPDPRLYIPPASLSDVERVNSVKLSGVYFSDTLRFDEHLKCVLTIFGGRVKRLRGQGLSRGHVNVFHSLTGNFKACVLPAGGGFS